MMSNFITCATLITLTSATSYYPFDSAWPEDSTVPFHTDYPGVPGFDNDPTNTKYFFAVPGYWNYSEPCYDEFMIQQDKLGWGECCIRHPWSANCQNYHPNDICFDEISLGPSAITSGWWGYYETPAWTSCCQQACTPLTMWDCDITEYCRPMEDQVDWVWENWGLWIIVALSIVGVVLMILIALCCCGCMGLISCCTCCGRSKKKEVHTKDSKAQEFVITPIVIAGQPPQAATPYQLTDSDADQASLYRKVRVAGMLAVNRAKSWSGAAKREPVILANAHDLENQTMTVSCDEPAALATPAAPAALPVQHVTVTHQTPARLPVDLTKDASYSSDDSDVSVHAPADSFQEDKGSGQTNYPSSPY